MTFCKKIIERFSPSIIPREMPDRTQQGWYCVFWIGGDRCITETRANSTPHGATKHFNKFFIRVWDRGNQDLYEYYANPRY